MKTANHPATGSSLLFSLFKKMTNQMSVTFVVKKIFKMKSVSYSSDEILLITVPGRHYNLLDFVNHNRKILVISKWVEYVLIYVDYINFLFDDPRKKHENLCKFYS